MGVAQNIYRLRGEAGWTQAELAEKLGVARPTVAQWENGWTSPRMGMVQRLAGVFGVSTEAIVTETPEPGMADLAAVWRTMSPEGQETLLAMARALAPRYPAEKSGGGLPCLIRRLLGLVGLRQ